MSVTCRGCTRDARLVILKLKASHTLFRGRALRAVSGQTLLLTGESVVSTQSVSLTPADAGALLTPVEVAKRLKVQVSYLNRLRSRHGLPHVKVGKEVRFDLVSVRSWIDQRSKSQAVNKGRS